MPRHSKLHYAFLISSGFVGDYVDPTATFIELHTAIGQRKQRPVAPHADVPAGVELGAALSNDNVASNR